jgi:hypothetical protein
MWQAPPFINQHDAFQVINTSITGKTCETQVPERDASLVSAAVDRSGGAAE